jgi:hypothetical protein
MTLHQPKNKNLLPKININLTLEEAKVLLDSLTHIGMYESELWVTESNTAPRISIIEQVMRKFVYASNPAHPRYEGYSEDDLRNLGVL